MNEVTQILQLVEQGNPQAAEELLPLVYNELRRVAARLPLALVPRGVLMLMPLSPRIRSEVSGRAGGEPQPPSHIVTP